MKNAPDYRSFPNLLSQVQRWQEGEAALREIKKLLQKDPRNALGAVFEVAEDCKLGWQMTLLWRFGVEAETMTLLKGFKPPHTLERAKELILAGSLHTFWSHVLDAKVEASAALVVGRDPYTAMEKTVLESFEELPATFGVIVETAQNDAIKEWAASRLATWTDTQIKLGERRERLIAVLAETGLPPEQAKLLGLLPASLVAFAEWQRDEPFRSGSGGKNYVSRAASVLEESGSEQAKKNENEEGKPPRLQYIDPKRPEDHDADPDMEAAEDREHNRRLLEKIELQTHFTERQRQVYELSKARQEDPEIAARLGIGSGTVRSHRKGALDAMRDAARKLGMLDPE